MADEQRSVGERSSAAVKVSSEVNCILRRKTPMKAAQAPEIAVTAPPTSDADSMQR